MALSDPEKLAKAWATAPSLHRYAVEKAEQKWRRDYPDWLPPETHELMTAEAAFRNQEFLKTLAVARDETRRELVGGRIAGLGRPTDANVIERVSDLFWVGADIDWTGGTVSRDGKTVVELRVVVADTLAPFQATARQRPGRPSEAEIICLAIADYAKRNRGLRGLPEIRHEAYRSFISDQGYDPKDPGFNKKTFEKYEREFRKGNKRLFPD